MATDKPTGRAAAKRPKARRTTGRSAGISQSAFAGYGHQQPAAPQIKDQDKQQQKEEQKKDGQKKDDNETSAEVE